MIVVILALLAIGWLAERHRKDRAVIIAIGVAIIGLALARGFYWHIFERGHGFFTANRTSALLIFLLAATAYPLAQRIRRLRGAQRGQPKARRRD